MYCENGHLKKENLLNSQRKKETELEVKVEAKSKANGLMRIRKMTTADVTQVAALERTCFSAPWSASGFQDALKQTGTLFVVAEEPMTGTIAGYCGMYVAADEGEITNVAVMPKMRNMHIADQIIATEKELAAAAGVARIFLEVRQSNSPAQALYQKHGFQSVGKRKNFYRLPQEDAIVMLCELERNTCDQESQVSI